MHRFLFNSKHLPAETIWLDEEESRHLTKVLRLNEGDEIIAFDGQGQEFHAIVVEISSKRVAIGQLNPTGFTREAPLAIHLVQGIAKGEKMDWVVQKATELGVHRITPLFTERTIVQLDEKRSRERQERWQKIAREAAKQSWRTLVPQVDVPQKLQQWYENINPTEPLLIPWEEEKSKGMKKTLQSWTEVPRKVTLLIGPEGGLTEAEVAPAFQKGAISLRLGPRILRTETAGLAAIAALMYELGDWG
ncbi:16S rRNA (uracil(1498)-N(3))-methyltransferase [Heliorestis convoluta]|uniref:Ribosomal RNA small subunit methyltransferase E n=1 Tax=Heliorestis convoluta TaxID=356322 RepID=A0A5Q2N3M0_9FIRM|nr:16S rRNA (uracil(1498)-N(3))-methyltransferase [Heliorestis convoluta]QGG47902.1 16S rRNA (uracil(1498)-N(3))-methyltransferase [Heliorestis convoluta]